MTNNSIKENFRKECFLINKYYVYDVPPKGCRFETDNELKLRIMNKLKKNDLTEICRMLIPLEKNEICILKTGKGEIVLDEEYYNEVSNYNKELDKELEKYSSIGDKYILPDHHPPVIGVGKPGVHADFEFIKKYDVIAITDLNKGNRSVTNDIEYVLWYITENYKMLGAPENFTLAGYKVIYKDSEGRWGGIKLSDEGTFVDFYSLGNPQITNTNEAFSKVSDKAIPI